MYKKFLDGFQGKRREGGFSCRLPEKKTKNEIFRCISIVIFMIAFTLFGTFRIEEYENSQEVKKEQRALIKEIEDSREYAEAEEAPLEKLQKEPDILPEYQSLYETNSDMIGWLKIPDTVIDYPVMQTMNDETYYLTRNFEKQDTKSGCLILDTDSVAGEGTKKEGYYDQKNPSTNLIIHGHTMKSGEMFGGLKYYVNPDYGEAHRYIYFDSLYEKRTFELIAVFYSQVYYSTDQVFKYYQFFQADTQEEFDDWYENIKKLSLYDTGVTAKFGDEFITLSCCSYHTEDGRFVVVGKRI